MSDARLLNVTPFAALLGFSVISACESVLIAGLPVGGIFPCRFGEPGPDTLTYNDPASNCAIAPKI